MVLAYQYLAMLDHISLLFINLYTSDKISTRND